MQKSLWFVDLSVFCFVWSSDSLLWELSDHQLILLSHLLISYLYNGVGPETKSNSRWIILNNNKSEQTRRSLDRKQTCRLIPTRRGRQLHDHLLINLIKLNVTSVCSATGKSPAETSNPQSPQWWCDASADFCPKFCQSGDKKLFGLFSRKSLTTFPQKSKQVRVSFVGHESEVSRTTQKAGGDGWLKEDVRWRWCPSSFQCFNAIPSLLYIFKRGWHWD